MAVFRPDQKVCELNFNDKYFYSLPLNEDAADNIDRAMQKIMGLSPKDKAGLDDAYNVALDALDELLGDGAADNIMSMYENPGTLQVWQVLLYILCEWKDAYNAEVEKIKTSVQLPNRSERRARR